MWRFFQLTYNANHFCFFQFCVRLSETLNGLVPIILLFENTEKVLLSSFCVPFEVTRVVSDPYLPLIAPGTTRLISQRMLTLTCIPRTRSWAK